jgi:hypothetical protein
MGSAAVIGAEPASPALPRALLAAFIAAVIAFEVWSTLGSVAGYLELATLASLVAFIGTAVWVVRAFLQVPRANDGATWWLLAALFVLEVPTTGFFEAAYLFERHLPAAFVADRATLSAASQMLGTFTAGLLIHRRDASTDALRTAFALLTVAGLATFAAYPWVSDAAYFLWTAAVTGFGSGGLTLLLCVAIVRDAGRAALLAALPSMAIMLGTEAGLEVLECVLAAARGAGLDTGAAFGVLFAAELAAAAAVMPLIARARRYG